jgi:hypothetical protein
MNRRPRIWSLASAVALSVGSMVAVTSVPASAVVPAHSTVGNYTLKVHWTNPVIKASVAMTLNADHSVDFSNNDVGNWSIAHKKITIFVSSATYVGTKTTTGFNGTMSNTDGNSGTWKAIFLTPI